LDARVTDPFPVPDMADVSLVEIMRALSDPTRLRIVQVLADGSEHPKATDIWGFEVQKSTMAHHWKTLREAGLTRTLVDGRTHTIQLRRAELDTKFPGLIAALSARA
jgi:DNA-binding transcriptional ArsR family regulator